KFKALNMSQLSWMATAVGPSNAITPEFGGIFAAQLSFRTLWKKPMNSVSLPLLYTPSHLRIGVDFSQRSQLSLVFSRSFCLKSESAFSKIESNSRSLGKSLN